MYKVDSLSINGSSKEPSRVGNSSTIHIAELKTSHSRKLPVFIDIVDVLNQTVMALNYM